MGALRRNRCHVAGAVPAPVNLLVRKDVMNPVDRRPGGDRLPAEPAWFPMNRLGWLWSAAVIAASIPPPAVNLRWKTTGGLHVCAHVAAFLAGALLIGCAGKTTRARGRYVPWLIAVAFLSELLEVLRYGNSFEWRDVAADVTGVLLGLGALLFRRIAFVRE